MSKERVFQDFVEDVYDSLTSTNFNRQNLKKSFQERYENIILANCSASDNVDIFSYLCPVSPADTESLKTSNSRDCLRRPIPYVQTGLKVSNTA